MLPGPRWLADPMAVTMGAQLAVAPLLVTTFGGVPVSSLPANLLAAPAAGLVMTWGLGAGIPAGLLGARAAACLQWPTALGIGWIATVARVSSSLPLGQLVARRSGARRRRGRRWWPLADRLAHRAAPGSPRSRRWRSWPLMAIVARSSLPAWPCGPPAGPRPPWPAASCGGAAGQRCWCWPASPGRPPCSSSLRRLGVRRIDLVVTTSGPKPAPGAVGDRRPSLAGRAGSGQGQVYGRAPGGLRPARIGGRCRAAIGRWSCGRHRDGAGAAPAGQTRHAGSALT